MFQFQENKKEEHFVSIRLVAVVNMNYVRVNYLLGVMLLYSLSGVELKSQKLCTIETKSGAIRGRQNRTLFENKLYYSFRGIPFAKPPIKHLRFKVKLQIV